MTEFEKLSKNGQISQSIDGDCNINRGGECKIICQGYHTIPTMDSWIIVSKNDVAFNVKLFNYGLLMLVITIIWKMYCSDV